MRYELQLRTAIALYSIVKYMKKPDEEKDAGPLPTYQPIKGQDALNGLRNWFTWLSSENMITGFLNVPFFMNRKSHILKNTNTTTSRNI